MSHVDGIDITARTRLLAILGHPVGHSLSPVMHNAALRDRGVDAVYLAFDVEPDDLAFALGGLKTLGFVGANVTVPHKETAARLMDALDPLAARVGAVNTVVNKNGLLMGHNTDVTGFASALESVRDKGVEGADCFVAGAGGAARAVVAALVEGRAGRIAVFNRTIPRAERVCAMVEEWGGPRCQVVDPSDVVEAVAAADIVVNATSVGLDPSVKESAVPVDILDSHHVVVDLVYGPRSTYLVAEAKERGAVAIDGREMLLMQAAASFELWTGFEAPVDVMRASIRQVGR